MFDTVHLRAGPLFWDSTRRGYPSAWWGHVPFANWLVATLRPKVVVELGTFWGVSYAAFCEAMELAGISGHCFAVDTWKGDRHSGFYNNTIYTDMQIFNGRYPFSKLLRMPFDEALPQFEPKSIDLLHIDGLHTYDAVKKDFENWLPKLSDRSVVLLHDTCEKQLDFGVWKLWKELSRRYPAFEFYHSHGLGVLGTGTDLPSEVSELLSQTAARSAMTREGIVTVVETLFSSEC